MFTGIIKALGTVQKMDKTEYGLRLTIEAPRELPAKIGASIALNGVCLTVVEAATGLISFDLIHETLERTGLGSLEVGDQLNLEPALTPQSLLDGHLVSGHIDAVGKLLSRSDLPDKGRILEVELPSSLAPMIAEKGSVALNGVSLTVTAVSRESFSVALIPLTLRETTLGSAQEGSAINIEVDVIARYVVNALRVKNEI
ncbi:riboflavin synthase [Candidatus Peregrinibacteria bacterium CG_4_9_14_0_2_um_filter_53_11]|nr:MAG: riboflavin synthase [Candidatus Peregrinibacteria bacterium CG_4_9_14_0_2_um_filter_53_11]